MSEPGKDLAAMARAAKLRRNEARRRVMANADALLVALEWALEHVRMPADHPNPEAWRERLAEAESVRKAARP